MHEYAELNTNLKIYIFKDIYINIYIFIYLFIFYC